MNKLVRKNKKGFTLTEMIVVIAIIGILAAVLIPSVVIYVNKAQQNAAFQQANAILDVYETYYTEKEAGLIDATVGLEDADGNDIGNPNFDFYDYYYQTIGKNLSSVLEMDFDTNSEKLVTMTYTADNGVIVTINAEDRSASYSD